MPEFMEQRARVLEAQQRRLAAGRLGEIADIHDQRRDRCRVHVSVWRDGGHSGGCGAGACVERATTHQLIARSIGSKAAQGRSRHPQGSFRRHENAGSQIADPKR